MGSLPMCQLNAPERSKAMIIWQITGVCSCPERGRGRWPRLRIPKENQQQNIGGRAAPKGTLRERVRRLSSYLLMVHADAEMFHRNKDSGEQGEQAGHPGRK